MCLFEKTNHHQYIEMSFKYFVIITKLFSRIASVIQMNLHVYKPVEVARITQALFLLQYQNPELFNKLRNILVK